MPSSVTTPRLNQPGKGPWGLPGLVSQSFLPLALSREIMSYWIALQTLLILWGKTFVFNPAGRLSLSTTHKTGLFSTMMALCCPKYSRTFTYVQLVSWGRKRTSISVCAKALLILSSLMLTQIKPSLINLRRSYLVLMCKVHFNSLLR